MLYNKKYIHSNILTAIIILNKAYHFFYFNSSKCKLG